MNSEPLTFALFFVDVAFKATLMFCFAFAWTTLLLFATGIPCFALLLVPYFYMGATMHIVGAVLFGFLPIFYLLFYYYLKWHIDEEYKIIEKFGARSALWIDQDRSWLRWSLQKPFKQVVAGWSDKSKSSKFNILTIGIVCLLPEREEESLHYVASCSWSYWVGAMQWAFRSPFSPMAAAFTYGFFYIPFLWKVNIIYFKKLGKLWLGGIVFICLSSPAQLILISDVLRISGNWIISDQPPLIVKWAAWNFTALAVHITNLVVEWEFVSRKHMSKEGFARSKEARNWLASFQTIMTRISIVISDISLPRYIMGTALDYDDNTIKESNAIMSSLGWPINVNLSAPRPVINLDKYKEWLITGTDWQQGIHNAKMYVDYALDPLRVKAVEFRRSETYASEENELESTARYFKSPKYDFPDILLDDVWFLVGDIFRHSRLTPFNYIIKMWEKKYGLGAFMRDPDRPWKKFSRKKFISQIGFANFKKLWRSTFEVAALLTPVAAVSIKGEALPPRKWMENKVRTVIGSPIGQYIMSTIWNYGPNHNFKWNETPIKVGMPLNGFWMSDTYARHSRCQHHFAGDMQDFDSTLTGPVADIIKAVRKKGYEDHKDHKRICALIDLNYHQVERQLLNTTSTGNIYGKGTGLTTGHSSTSTDNSVATVVLYYIAWKHLTGLSARDFKFYNELSCYGDDHILSILSSKHTN